jgi:arylsulfatase A-like enzyme
MKARNTFQAHPKSLIISLLLLLALFSGSCTSDENPNIIFILVDDLGWTDLGCYGSEFYDTPNLDDLATRSVRFTNAYAASPVCSPTRAAIMTGKHPARVNITDWIPGMSISRASDPKLIPPEDIHNLPLSEFTIAEAFRDRGYRTFFAGKWHLGETAGFWPEFQGFEINKGGNSWGAPRSNDGAKGYYSPYNNPTLENGPDGEYLTDRLTDESIQFLDAAGDDPFFLYLAFYTVHTPIMGCEKYDEFYTGNSLQLPGKGEMLTREEHDTQTRINQSNPKYAAMVRSMDANVGRLLEKLEEKGQADNTIIVFTSDNGGLTTVPQGGPTAVVPLRAGKGWCYEGGIRVPLLISYPGMQHAGEVCDVPAISMDYYPTLLELAGLEPNPGQHIDGNSIVPYLEDPQGEANRTMVWHFPHYHGSAWKPGSAIRDGNWKLIEFYEDNKVELYDLENDVEERVDLAEELPEMAAKLRTRLHAELDKMGANYPVPK